MSVLEGEISIERLVPGGRGFARTAAGKPVFVRGALPGDRIRPLELVDKRSFLEVESFELLETGPHRVTPSCEDEARCGGCDLMRLTEPAQGDVKLGILREALERTGGFRAESLPPIAFHSHAATTGYRLRVRLQVQNGRLGFFSAASHEIVEPRACQVASPELRELLAAVRSRVHAVPEAFGGVESIEVRVLPPGPAHAAGALLGSRSSLFVALRKGQRADRALSRALDGLRNVAAVRVTGESDTLEQQLWVTDDVFVRSPVGGFCQVNPGVNRGLIQTVLEVAAETKARTFLDLYSGSGNFSLPLAKSGLSGLGIELGREATEAAQRGALEQGLDRVQFRAGDVAREVETLARSRQRYDLVIVDPPRAGARSIASTLPKLATRSLVMVSCDPVTFARDLKELVARGAVVERLEAWDMFPQTHHVETLCVLNCAATDAC